MFEYRLHTASAEETKDLAHRIAQQLSKGDVIAMTGDLAAGKTTFTQGLTEYFKVEEYALSPTFTYINEYHARDMDIIHIDAYRLHNGEELISMGIWEYYDSAAIVIIEWADIVQSAIPAEAIGISIRQSEAGETHRDFLIQTPRAMEL